MKITINHQPVDVKDGITIMEACQSVGIDIPSLCFLKDISSNASCGICVVEVKGARSLLRSCITKVAEGMEILTTSPRVLEARKVNVELLLANHPQDCLQCDRNLNCELQRLSFELGIKERHFVRTRKKYLPKDETSLSLVRDPEKCILCGRCVAVCSDMQSVNAIDFSGRGLNTSISTFFDKGLGATYCTNCGQCSLVCPTGAITEKTSVPQVWKEILNPEKMVLIQTAPAVRVGIGEAMGMPYGSLVTGQMVAGLKRLGFSKVFDTNFAADLTIMEEANELMQRIRQNGVLPMITSCSPGWIKFAEHFFPSSLAHLSSCKSPQQMFGAIAKTFYAEQTGIDPRKIVVVSVMPCTAKKYEARRPEMDDAFHYWKEKLQLSEEEHFFDVDYALTTRELARMFKESGIDFQHLPEEDFDQPLGVSTGAGTIFGATGGVMEAALRTAYEVMTGRQLKDVEFLSVRGMKGIKEAEIDLDGRKIKVAVAHTLKNARFLLEQIRAGISPYTFVEIMTCPGGCLGGGGQPIPTNSEIREKRAASIYREDERKQIRKSHENPEIQYLYEHFLEKPLSEKSHHLLHTHYVERGC
ncbi:MAG: NADP-reducing hydrogenase subunit HndC [Bacteroidetes bacterium ADurb.BinA395]|nr:MAG: NADP-reducing hydrogenase subunit HndC [Bacteroidetes bacterium ADurb.BinA395]HOF98797.1 NADH-dependent [FeFe] hydrogenase, group A6 [Paludibacteraceae bacterium]HOR39262.1 NADH-dependent [FeFe] hydrogenase, group A6 [Paludibacteraceae bacterium]